jgi:hypothetical protein
VRVLATVGSLLAALALLAVLSWLSLSGGASRVRRGYGLDAAATRVVDVPAGRKVAGVAWRGDTLWVLTRPAVAGEPPDEGWSLREEPSWGWRSEVLLRPQGGQ